MRMLGGTSVPCLMVAHRMTQPAYLQPSGCFGIPTAILPDLRERRRAARHRFPV